MQFKRHKHQKQTSKEIELSCRHSIRKQMRSFKAITRNHALFLLFVLFYGFINKETLLCKYKSVFSVISFVSMCQNYWHKAYEIIFEIERKFLYNTSKYFFEVPYPIYCLICLSNQSAYFIEFVTLCGRFCFTKSLN